MIKKLPPLSIYETARTYWPDIVDILRMINSDGRTFYSKNFRKLKFRERVIAITEEAAKTVSNYSTTIVEFYNDRYKVLMRYGDSTTPLSAELYVLFRNQDSNNKRVGYLKCNKGIITLRNMEPCDYSGEIIFKSIFMALPGPISYLIKKVTGIRWRSWKYCGNANDSQRLSDHHLRSLPPPPLLSLPPPLLSPPRG